MEIIKAFTDNQYTHNITILGDNNNPLFRASEIADVLEIKSYHSSIDDFNETEKEYRNIKTPGGNQNVIFLTEKGLYKLLFRSRKPIAIEFQNWVCEVIKELRLKGNYDVQQKLEQQNKELEEQKKENEKLKKDLQKKITNTPVIYIYNTDARDTVKESILKIGATEKLHNRIKPYKQTHPYGKVVYTVEIDTSIIGLKIFEDWIHQLLKTHNIRGEMFNIDIDEAKYLIIHTLNTIKLINMSNKELRKTKLFKLVDTETIIVNNLKNPNISTCDASTQVDFEMIDKTYETTDDVNNRFEKYITECCEIDSNAEVSSKNISGQYRLWSKTADKESYLKLNDYLTTKFKPIRMSLQTKSGVVNGFKGIKLKPILYKQKLFTEVEIFVFSNCVFSSDAKVLRNELMDEYLDWKKRNNKDINIRTDTDNLTKYLNECEYILKSNIWAPGGNGIGYYGLNLKTNINYQNKISSTSKKVNKIDKDNNVVDGYITIAKAAEAAGIPPTRMSRSIKNKIEVDGFLYVINSNS